MFLFGCEPEWTNPLEVDEELKFTPEIKELKQTENHDILIVLNRVYSDSVELQFEREENEIYVPVKLSRYNLYSYIDSVFDKEVPHRFRYRYRVKKGDYTTEYSVSKGIDYSGDYLYGPVGVQKRVIELRGVQLRWRDRSQREEYYIIERDAGGGYEEIAELPANSESYLDSISGVYNPPLYLRYRIYARRGEVKSEALEYEVEYSGLGSPGNLRIADSSSWNFTIEWEDNSNIEDGYIVERSKDGLGYEEVARLSANSRSYTEVIEEEGSYSYRVRAYKGSYYSGYSNEVSITIKSLVPTKGLIAYYPFNGNANDESGNGLDGMVYGATLTKDRFNRNNRAYFFDGKNDYIYVKYNSLFNFSPKGDFSICIWIKNLSTNNWWKALLVKSKSNGSWDYGLYLTPDNRFMGGLDNRHEVYSNIKTYAEWRFVVLIYKNGNWKLYVDKKLEGYKINGNKIKQSAGGIALGKKGERDSDYFKGYLDDIRIYNRALDDKEIQALYHENGWK